MNAHHVTRYDRAFRINKDFELIEAGRRYKNKPHIQLANGLYITYSFLGVVKLIHDFMQTEDYRIIYAMKEAEWNVSSAISLLASVANVLSKTDTFDLICILLLGSAGFIPLALGIPLGGLSGFGIVYFLDQFNSYVSELDQDSPHDKQALDNYKRLLNFQYALTFSALLFWFLSMQKLEENRADKCPMIGSDLVWGYPFFMTVPFFGSFLVTHFLYGVQNASEWELALLRSVEPRLEALRFLRVLGEGVSTTGNKLKSYAHFFSSMTGVLTRVTMVTPAEAERIGHYASLAPKKAATSRHGFFRAVSPRPPLKGVAYEPPQHRPVTRSQTRGQGR